MDGGSWKEPPKVKLQRKNRLRALSLGAVAVTGALTLTACGSDDTGGNNAGGGSTAPANSKIDCGDATGQLLADGSSAQKNAIDAWVKQYTASCKSVQINYKGSGSGAGITAFTQGQVAFAGSDSALKPEEVTASKEVCKGGQGIDLPMVGGPIAVGYNVPGVDTLVLDAKTLALIFDSKITNWNDKAIAALNPDAKLPDLKIQPYHRSDESGTTDNFTKYLIAAAPDNWKYEGGKAWQAKGGQSAQGSSGVAQGVKETKGAISYMELSYAKDGMSTVDIKTGAPEPVKATVENATKAISEAQVVGTGKDLALKLNYTPTAEGAYPITLVTYEIVCDKGNKADTLPATKSFLTYIASEDGQGLLADAGYAPMPEEIITKVRSTISGLS
ncbi:phosphate ABC transporter substrate-binding protein PstS [Streptomyces sp. JV178]|nr:phosphate ABC transporter substrate-binding protein PstS [Streptomyces sp. JV178]